ncbi:MAG TPA: DUF4352 domain-containing protein, partial [Ktedonobacterales bacterium]
VCCIAPLVLSALGALAGIGGTYSQGTSSSTPQPTAGVGAMITISDVACTLLSVRSIGGDDIVKPKAGNHFIVVHITLTNNSSSEVHYNPFDFHIESGDGNITDHEIITPSTYTANNELHDGALAPGGTVTADLIFQVATGDHQAKLTWQPSFFGSDTDYVWLLGL